MSKREIFDDAIVAFNCACLEMHLFGHSLDRGQVDGGVHGESSVEGTGDVDRLTVRMAKIVGGGSADYVFFHEQVGWLKEHIRVAVGVTGAVVAVVVLPLLDELNDVFAFGFRAATNHHVSNGWVRINGNGEEGEITNITDHAHTQPVFRGSNDDVVVTKIRLAGIRNEIRAVK